MVWVWSKLNLPPNSCMPSREKMMIKRKRRSSKDAMDFIELSRDATKLLRDAQCLQQRWGGRVDMFSGESGARAGLQLGMHWGGLG